MEIDHLPITICALLGQVELSLPDYMSLQLGDILILDQSVENPLSVIAGDKKLFKATPGLSEIHKAVRIVKND